MQNQQPTKQPQQQQHNQGRKVPNHHHQQHQPKTQPVHRQQTGEAEQRQRHKKRTVSPPGFVMFREFDVTSDTASLSKQRLILRSYVSSDGGQEIMTFVMGHAERKTLHSGRVVNDLLLGDGDLEALHIAISDIDPLKVYHALVEIQTKQNFSDQYAQQAKVEPDLTEIKEQHSPVQRTLTDQLMNRVHVHSVHDLKNLLDGNQ